MSKTLFKLRLFGIAAFLLFFISSMISLPNVNGSYAFNLVQQISMLVSFVIFGFLMLIHLYGLYVRLFRQEEES